MAAIPQHIYLDLGSNAGGGRVVASPRDPSPREFGPVVTLGDKIYWDVYPGSVSGQVFDTLALPSDRECSLVAQRADGLSPVVAFSADGTAASGADGFRFWRCPVDVTDAELGTNSAGEEVTSQATRVIVNPLAQGPDLSLRVETEMWEEHYLDPYVVGSDEFSVTDQVSDTSLYLAPLENTFTGMLGSPRQAIFHPIFHY